MATTESDDKVIISRQGRRAHQYHKPDCHVIEYIANTREVSKDYAETREHSPCKHCHNLVDTPGYCKRDCPLCGEEDVYLRTHLPCQ